MDVWAWPSGGARKVPWKGCCTNSACPTKLHLHEATKLALATLSRLTFGRVVAHLSLGLFCLQVDGGHMCPTPTATKSSWAVVPVYQCCHPTGHVQQLIYRNTVGAHPCDLVSVFHPQIICWEVISCLLSRLLKYNLRRKWLTRWIQWCWMDRSLPCYYQ